MTGIISGMFQFPSYGEAAPLTEPTEENIQKFNEYMTSYIQSFPELTISNEINIDSQYFSPFMYLKSKNLLKQEFIDRSFATTTRSDFADILMTVLSISQTKSKTQIPIPEDIKKHPKNQMLTEALKMKILSVSKNKLLKPDETITNKEIEAGLKILKIKSLGIPKVSLRNADLLSFLAYHLQNLEQSKILLRPKNFISKISIQNQDIMVDGKPLRGIFVKWLIDESHDLSPSEIKSELKKMKDMGIIGIATEIGWKDTMPDPNTFRAPKYMDNLLQVAGEMNMPVQLLLSPHYTPAWVFAKYPQDIRMVDIDGIPRDEGEYIRYSLLSPAIEDEIAWKQKAIQYYSKFNILTFYLSNEVSYGKTFQLDFSSWMEAGWKEWLKENKLAERAMPRNEGHADWKLWQLFRQKVLKDYLNKIYDGSKKALPRFIPLAHKTIPYESTSFYAPMYGVHPSPLELKGDIFAPDTYGFTPNTYTFFHNSNLPIAIPETNLPNSIVDREWDANTMFKYLINNYLHGANIQAIFQWNCGEHPNVLFRCDGTPWAKTSGVKRAADLIANLGKTFQHPQPKSAVIFNTNATNVFGKNFQENQYRYDTETWALFQNLGEYPMNIWSDDLPGIEKYYYELPAKTYPLDALKNVEYIALHTHPLDPIMESPFLKQFQFIQDLGNGSQIWKRK